MLISGLPCSLLWNFLLFENYRQEVGDQYIVGPQPKSWGTSLPRSLRLLRLCMRQNQKSIKKQLDERTSQF